MRFTKILLPFAMVVLPLVIFGLLACDDPAALVDLPDEDVDSGGALVVDAGEKPDTGESEEEDAGEPSDASEPSDAESIEPSDAETIEPPDAETIEPPDAEIVVQPDAGPDAGEDEPDAGIPDDAGALSTVGGPCATANDCEGNLNTCLQGRIGSTNWPASGYCTKGCNTSNNNRDAGLANCPAGSVCTNPGSGGSVPSPGCYQRCGGDAGACPAGLQCRWDNNSNNRICRP